MRGRRCGGPGRASLAGVRAAAGAPPALRLPAAALPPLAPPCLGPAGRPQRCTLRRAAQPAVLQVTTNAIRSPARPSEATAALGRAAVSPVTSCGHRCVSVQWRLSKLNEGGSDTATVVFLSPGSHHEAARGGCRRKALGRLRQVRRAAESAVSEETFRNNLSSSHYKNHWKCSWNSTERKGYLLQNGRHNLLTHKRASADSVPVVHRMCRR